MKYIKRNKAYKFELAEDETQLTPITEYAVTRFVELDPDMGEIWIGKGYAWDGSSIPFKRFMQKITFGKYDSDKYCKEASLVHDAFYQLMRLNKLSRNHKDTSDRLYEKMCIEGAKKIIHAEWNADRAKILAVAIAKYISEKKLDKKLNKLTKKNNKRLKRLPGWAARRYWAVKHFGARTLKPRYYPEKEVLET